MKILIPSTNRADRVKTIKSLGTLTGHEITVVVKEEEFISYLGNVVPGVRVRGVHTQGIRSKRQAIIDIYSECGKIVMIDDDITFRKRIDQSHFAPFEDGDGQKMLDAIEDLLDVYAHVGLADRFMIQHTPRGSTTGRRYHQLLAYNFDKIAKPYPTFRVECNEEHDFSLQLRARGHIPGILTEYVKSDTPYAKGGCSTWRTAEAELDAHKKFAELWPGVVTIVPNKNAISGFVTKVNWRKVK